MSTPLAVTVHRVEDLNGSLTDTLCGSVRKLRVNDGLGLRIVVFRVEIIELSRSKDLTHAGGFRGITVTEYAALNLTAHDHLLYEDTAVIVSCFP